MITATGDSTASISAPNPLDFAVNDLNVQASLEPHQVGLFAGSGGNEISQPSASSQYLAFLDGNDGPTTNVVPNFNFPPGLFELFKEAIPQFDLNGVLNWFANPEPPQCEGGKFAFCCEFGAPERASRDVKKEEETEEAKAIRLGRRKKCNECEQPSHSLIPYPSTSEFKWGNPTANFLSIKIGRADSPACHFPENEFCCFCRDRVSPKIDSLFCTFLKFKLYCIITAAKWLRMLPLTLEERSPLPR